MGTALVLSILALFPNGEKVNRPLASDTDVNEYFWAPNGRRILYRTTAGVGTPSDLFSVGLRTRSVVRLGGLPVTLEPLYPLFAFDANNRRVLFRTSFFPYPQYDHDTDLYSVPLGGGLPPVPIDSGSTNGALTGLLVLSDGRAIYSEVRACCSGAPRSYHLFRITVDGSQPAAELHVSTLGIGALQVTQAEDLAVFVEGGPSGTITLRSVPVDGSAPASAIGPALAKIEMSVLQAAGSHLYFTGAYGALDPIELWRIPITGGTPQRISPALASDRSIETFRFTPDGTNIVYLADQDANDVEELYVVPAAGGASLKLSGPLVAGGDVIDDTIRASFVLSPDGTRVAYRADAFVDGVIELFTVPTDGSAPAVRLNPPLSGTRDAYTFLFTLDGQHVVYAATQDVATRMDLYCAPADASQAAVRLTPPMVANGGVDSEHLSLVLDPSGTGLFYVADQEVDGRVELFRVPLDGSQASVKLNGPLVTGGDVWNFKVGPTGDVLYLADEEQDHVLELFLARAPVRRPLTRDAGEPTQSVTVTR